MNNTCNFGFITATLLCWCLIVAACDENFVPLEENDQYHFSIYGYLDASADTQWVRVMPVREELFLDHKPLDAIVTLEHVESGDTVVMNDSLFAYAHGVYAWNFWTTMSLLPGETYRLKAESTTGLSSYAMITLPEDYPVPLVHIRFVGQNRTPDLTTIYIEGVERLADVQSVFHTPATESGIKYTAARPHLKDTTRSGTNSWRVNIDPLEDYQYLNSFLQLNPPVQLTAYLTPASPYEPQIFVASAGPGYHFFPSIDDNVMALPDGVSNIVNGTGYIAGIISKTVPYQNCVIEGTTDVEPCPLEPPPW